MLIFFSFVAVSKLFFKQDFIEMQLIGGYIPIKALHLGVLIPLVVPNY